MKILLIVLFNFCLIWSALSAAPQPPTQYVVQFNFEVPQWAKSNLPRVIEPVVMYYDGVNNKQRIVYWGGIEQSFHIGRSDGSFEVYHIHPRGDDLVCSGSIQDSSLVSAFPNDLSGYVFSGNTVINGTKCDVYKLYVPKEGANNNYTYTVVSGTNVPVSYDYIGYSSSMAGYLNSPNYDWFVSNYSMFKPNYYNASDFTLPAICSNLKKAHNVITPNQRLAHMFHISPEVLFKEFTSQYKKVYSSEDEKDMRKKHFVNNLNSILRHRWEYNAGLHTHILALNHLADKSEDELNSLSNCYRPYAKEKITDYHVPITKDISALPSSWDWRTKNAVSVLKDQGDCGSCWSFSATGAAESAYFLKHGVMVTLSEQYLLDCSWGELNAACDGGSQGGSYDYVIKHNKGMWPTEAQYPYKMNPQMCQSSIVNNVTVVAKKHIFPFDQHALMDACVNKGPIAISVSTKGWTFYHSGVLDDSRCNTLSIDHCVLLTGYGTDTASGKDYWMIKNQWSEYWGIEGYIMVARGWNRCGVETAPLYPEVA